MHGTKFGRYLPDLEYLSLDNIFPVFVTKIGTMYLLSQDPIQDVIQVGLNSQSEAMKRLDNIQI